MPRYIVLGRRQLASGRAQMASASGRSFLGSLTTYDPLPGPSVGAQTIGVIALTLLFTREILNITMRSQGRALRPEGSPLS